MSVWVCECMPGGQTTMATWSTSYRKKTNIFFLILTHDGHICPILTMLQNWIEQKCEGQTKLIQAFKANTERMCHDLACLPGIISWTVVFVVVTLFLSLSSTPLCLSGTHYGFPPLADAPASNLLTCCSLSPCSCHFLRRLASVWPRL